VSTDVKIGGKNTFYTHVILLTVYNHPLFPLIFTPFSPLSTRSGKILSTLPVNPVVSGVLIRQARRDFQINGLANVRD